MQDDLSGYSILNYLSSHDDGSPFDPRRERAIEAGSKLLLTPGASQIYYGDETARSLVIEGTIGDATLRSNMNWQELDANQGILDHWQKLGRFRAKHPAIGMGLHQMISQSPYTFYRSYYQDGKNDLVAIGLEMNKGEKELDVSKLYEDGTVLFDAYSGQEVKVVNGKAVVNSEYDVVLLEVKE